jgi:nucleoside-diphosphate-sugar epimerase/1-acyl-sn-glycerol-3-phosphate acyltransferase
MATRATKASGSTRATRRRCILVTGASRSTGRRLVKALAGDEWVARVIAVDSTPPPGPLPRKVEVLQADLGSPALIKALESGAVDTLVHLGVSAEPRAAGGRASMKEHNVVGTMHLLAAAYHAPDLRRLVLKSTTAVYGAAPGDPAVWTESMSSGTPRSGFGKDAIEIEDYVRAFDRRRPDVTVTILRLANQVGPTVSNPLTRYFELPVCPTVLGFDPRLQFLHESDTEQVLERVILGPAVRGTFNVAGDGVVLLSQAIRIAGKPPAPIPEPLVPAVAGVLGSTIDFSPEQARFLQYGRVADTGAARERLGFSPKWSSQEAFRDFAASRLSPLVSEEQVERFERQAQEVGDFLARRLTGRYQVDEFGYDPELVDHVLAPLLRPLYRSWWRVETRGLEHVPESGAALVVGNHAGTLPFDAMMVALALHDEHPAHRTLRMLAADLAFTLPVVAPLARKSGNTLACEEDAERLLAAGELVGVWPEGYKGLGKPFSERYRLRRFGRGGFVELALRNRTPIVPVAIVGSEEIYPMIGNLRRVARMLGLPYLPVTPTFPLLGPLGAVPLPSKWLIEFCPPIETAGYGPEAVLDPMVVFDLTDQVRDTIQRTIDKNLAGRRGPFG